MIPFQKAKAHYHNSHLVPNTACQSGMFFLNSISLHFSRQFRDVGCIYYSMSNEVRVVPSPICPTHISQPQLRSLSAHFCQQHPLRPSCYLHYHTRLLLPPPAPPIEKLLLPHRRFCFGLKSPELTTIYTSRAK